jgi:predicted membrane-bound dolichyl-phosphate-mannose-protein mannosyltransferase
MKQKIFIVLIIFFICHFLFRVYSYRNEYLQKFDPNYWKERYLHSQWIVLHSKEPIGDDGLYTYVAWEYINGRDPTTLNAELPPLGKYAIGFFELVFSNQNYFGLFSGLLVLISFFVLNKQLVKDNLLAFLPVFLFSFDPLFFTQLRAPFLDLFYLGLLLLTFIFVLKEKFWLAAVFLGLTTATKSSASTFPLIVIAIGVYLIYMKHYRELKKFLLTLPLAIIVFLLTYFRFFMLGHTLREFLSVQKWILAFYEGGAKGNPLAVWQILFTGQWPNWFGPTLPVSEWNFLWPLSLLATIYYFFMVVPKRRLYNSILLGIWVALYILFLTIIPVWPRYLLLLLPFMYNLAIWVLSKSMPLLSRRLSFLRHIS